MNRAEMEFFQKHPEQEPKGPDLKRVLMDLGNRLVLEHKFTPATAARDGEVRSTYVLKVLTDWFNALPEAREVLESLGYSWSMPAPLRPCPGIGEQGRLVRSAPGGDTIAVCPSCHEERRADMLGRMGDHQVRYY